MADQPVSIAEEIAAALAIALLRRGVIDESDIAEMELSEDARGVAESLIVEAQAPSVSDWQAGQRRGRLHVVEGSVE